MAWVGRSLRRFRDPVLLRGEGRFTADLADNAVSLRFVRSPLARGRILAIESEHPGQTFTAADLSGVKPIRPLLHRPDYVPVDQPILAADRVCFVGEPIAAVIGESPEQAEDLAAGVFVDIEPEDAVVDIDRALEPGAPAVHGQAPNNVLIEGNMRTPGVDAAFAGAAEIIEFEIRSRRQSAMPLEARAAHAAFDAASARITLTASVQMPHMLRTGLADLLGIAESDLRVVAPDVGGGFGQKMSLAPEYAVVVWLAGKLRRPVRWIEDRRENLMASFHSRDQHYTVRGAFDAEGKLDAIDADLSCNVGAYSCYPVTCGVEPLMAMAEFPGPYDFQEYGVRARGVATNTCPMAPYRGVSRPVITLAMERLMDLAAERFGVEPVEIRRRNLIDSFPYRTATGLEYDEGSYRQAMEMAEQAIDLKAFRTRQNAARGDGRYLGIGFSVFCERGGYGTPAFAARAMDITPGFETVEISMDPSGFVEARIGASPHGQGLQTSLAQIIADELGMAPEHIRIIHGDTDRTPYGWGTFASRSMVISGGASKLAAQKLKARLTAAAAQHLQAESAEITIEDGRAAVRGGGAGISLSALARAAYHQSHQFADLDEPALTARATYDPPGTFSNACHAAIVEVDRETGQVAIERYVVVEDAGRLINPLIVDGQIMGGVAQGIANALYEEIVYDEDGNLLTTLLMDYLVPTAAELPDIEIHHLETISDASITKAKGVGEGGTIGAPAAVLGAVSDALKPFNAGIFEMPITPQRIRELLRGA
ncbi:MAG: xanthine dehydrogenase family protein molybdopterin-binding subunit [Alphaproteobacteria bacterium]|jgi:carbon-monoxide dehydrogenase large subunit|nr:xanthine dehydrogenase family protein molybdopterin-binding subunit [Alphaproteobacteria bacterium]MDP6819217.1 xanthine dehydrogenase family protein molybdopterin-binding subunit [Alphaproteobacteria bacterium]